MDGWGCGPSVVVGAAVLVVASDVVAVVVATGGMVVVGTVVIVTFFMLTDLTVVAFSPEIRFGLLLVADLLLLFANLLILVANLLSLVADLLPLVANLLSLVANLLSLVADLLPLIADLLSLVANLLPLVADLIIYVRTVAPLVADFTTVPACSLPEVLLGVLLPTMFSRFEVLLVVGSIVTMAASRFSVVRGTTGSSTVDATGHVLGVVKVQRVVLLLFFVLSWPAWLGGGRVS